MCGPGSEFRECNRRIGEAVGITAARKKVEYTMFHPCVCATAETLVTMFRRLLSLLYENEARKRFLTFYL